MIQIGKRKVRVVFMTEEKRPYLFGDHYRALPRRTYAVPLPQNTLTNVDGTPYQAGHDTKTSGQVAYEAFQDSVEYKHMYRERFGYDLNVIPWNELLLVEQRAWEEVAEAVLGHVHPSSS